MRGFVVFTCMLCVRCIEVGSDGRDGLGSIPAPFFPLHTNPHPPQKQHNQNNRDLNAAEPLAEVAAAAREKYQARERAYEEAVGRLAAKRTQVCFFVRRLWVGGCRWDGR